MSTGLDRTRDERRFGRLDQPLVTRRAIVPRVHYDPEAFGKFSERIASFIGTARFLVYMTAFIVVWLSWNAFVPHAWRFDPYPYIFLTLMLSLQASYAAPLILLAQDRQADRDRVQYEQDRARGERSVSDTEYLTREIASLRSAMNEVATRDWIRDELEHLLRRLDSHGPPGGSRGDRPAP